MGILCHEENMYKFDAGFYEKIQQMQIEYDRTAAKSDQTARQQSIPTHPILINTINGTEYQLREILLSANARDIFVSTALDFVSADVPIDRIAELANYTFIYKIGDEPPFEELGLNMDQAKSASGASNIPAHPYNYHGTGITVAVIDRGVDFSHPDLEGKQAGKVNCGNSNCPPTTKTHDHGTALAAIIAGNSTDDSRDGIA